MSTLGSILLTCLRALFLLSLALGAGACGSKGSERPQPRLVVLYTTCTLNREFIGPYGEGVEYTPNLDAFAAESMVFDRHQSESGQSGISFASIFSGTQVDQHLIYHHPKTLSQDLYLITEAYRDAGYEPWFWSGHNMAAANLDYGQGVPEGNAWHPGKQGHRKAINSFLQPNDEMFQRLLAKLRANPEYKAFLQINFTVTHGAYHKQAPQRFYFDFLKRYPQASMGLKPSDLKRAWGIYGSLDANRKKTRLQLQWDYENTIERLGLSKVQVEALIKGLEVTYRADVAFLDTMFGNTMTALREEGLMEDSLIGFTVDHGETLFREGTLFHWTHGLQLAPEVLQVPFMIRAPRHEELGFKRGRYPQVTRSIDVYPTLAGLCGIDLQGKGIAGADLSGALLGQEQAPELLAFSHTTTIGDDSIDSFRSWEKAAGYWDGTDVERIWVRVRQGDQVFKLINVGDESFEFRAFDLARDPWEAKDLFDPENPLHADMAGRLQAYKKLLIERFDERNTDDPENAQDLLDALGYTDSGTDEEEED